MKYTFVKYDQLCHSERSNEIAKSKNLKIGLRAVLFATIFLAACGDDNKNAGGTVEDGEVIAIADKTVSGVSQKGPFVNGSSVTVQELDGETLAQTGNSYEGKIKNDMGEFSVKVTKLASQYALLKANGFYRNEVSGEKSKSQVTLYALTDLSNRDEVNVNLLTHLAYERSLYLASDDSVTVAAAKKRSEKEVLASFGMDVDFSNAEDLNIFGKGDESAALLAVSILMQGDLNEADFSERLADYAADIETDGKWDDSKTATDIADWAAAKSLGKNLSYIRTKIENWGLSADVPAFEKYVDVYWWENYGLGKCNSKREGEVLKNANSLSRNFNNYFICENDGWRVAYDTEYDTYQQKCDKDGKIVYGNVNKDYAYDCDVKTWRHASNVEAALGGCIETRFGEVAIAVDEHYICKNRAWTLASDIEKDTYKWAAGKDGDVKFGDVVKTNCYVYENITWRSGNKNDCNLKLRGCTALRQDTVGKGIDKVWHICDNKSWRDATDIEKDTATWSAGKFDGEVRNGQVNTSIYYIYEDSKKAWRLASDLEKDTYDYKKNKDWAVGKDGDSKLGSVNTDKCYVYEDSAWRAGNENDCSLKLRGCTALRQDTVGLGSDKVWHICDSKSWRNATTYEKDTFGWKDSTDGVIKKGNVTDTVYVFDKTTWRYATITEIDTYKQVCSEFGQIAHGNINADYVYFCYGNEWKRFYGNESVSYGKLVDERDGEIYRTVRIGDQTWMAENLNYADSANYPSMLKRNWCYENKHDSCEKYGRLYTWSATIDSVYWKKKGKTCGYEVEPCNLPDVVRGICPEGWHVPNGNEWKLLYSSIGSNSYAMQAKGFSKWPKATDEYGLSVFPTGYYYLDEFEEDSFARFWSATEDEDNLAYLWCLKEGSAVLGGSYGQNYGFSVRCLKD